MNEFDEIQSVWKQQTFSPKTEVNTITMNVTAYARKRKRRTIGSSVSLFFLVIIMIDSQFFDRDNHSSSSFIIAVIIVSFYGLWLLFKFVEIWLVSRISETQLPVKYLLQLKNYHLAQNVWKLFIFPLAWALLAGTIIYRQWSGLPGSLHGNPWLTMSLVITLLLSFFIFMQLVHLRQSKQVDELIAEFKDLQIPIDSIAGN